MNRFALIVAAFAAATAFAQDKKAPDKGIAVGEADVITATVESVDVATRNVALKGPKGNVVVFKVRPEVNLGQVAKGDIVTIAYVQAAAMSLRKTDSKVRERVETEIKQGAPKDAKKPSGMIGADVKVTATVEAIDAKKQLVTLRGPERTVVLQVKDPNVLKGVKVGDNVEAEYVEAVAFKVEKGPPPTPVPAPKK